MQDGGRSGSLFWGLRRSCLYIVAGARSFPILQRSLAYFLSAPDCWALLTLLSTGDLREVRHRSLKIYCDSSGKWINEHIIPPFVFRAVCLIKCERRAKSSGADAHILFKFFSLSEELKGVMKKGAVIWNIIPLPWWNYKDGESSQITRCVFYQQWCPCWGGGTQWKPAQPMRSDSTVTALRPQSRGGKRASGSLCTSRWCCFSFSHSLWSSRRPLAGRVCL